MGRRARKNVNVPFKVVIVILFDLTSSIHIPPASTWYFRIFNFISFIKCFDTSDIDRIDRRYHIEKVLLLTFFYFRSGVSAGFMFWVQIPLKSTSFSSTSDQFNFTYIMKLRTQMWTQMDHIEHGLLLMFMAKSWIIEVISSEITVWRNSTFDLLPNFCRWYTCILFYYIT